jgi:hypothetical protein
MRINELREVLKRLIMVNESILLVGHAGVGKTTVVKTIAQELNRPVKTVILSTLEPGDLLGVPHIVGNETVYERPSWLPKEDEHGIVLFLDELNRAPTYVLQTILQLVLEHRVGPHKLPDDMAVIAAINPDTEEYTVTSLTDRALLSRFIIIPVQNSASDLIDYFNNKGYDTRLAMAAVKGLDRLGKFTEVFPVPAQDPNPRSFEKAIKIYSIVKDLPTETKLEVLTGVIGKAAAQFLIDVEQDVLTIEDVLANNKHKFEKAISFERITVILDILKNGKTDQIPNDIIDMLSNEEVAAIIRHVKTDPTKYGPEFVKLRKKFPRFKELLQ